ncbi:MAG: hypothetical protein IJ702_07435 [Fretibacterium sp.]|nr:hypothetical protein [Fretibacterium sp.]
MSIYGLTKGTELEKMVSGAAQAEANGTMVYYALARLAREQGFVDVAEQFIEIANQEAVHAGFYAVLNGQYPQDFWEFAASMQKAEANAEGHIGEIAAKVRALGEAKGCQAECEEAAREIEVFAAQEKNHGVILDGLLKKYHPQA